ncbi:DUF2878 family protein [Candidatus Binatia bacterium]|nr:DUF2878 family protein [Candidatus Binatia bacterium]
MSRWLNFVMFYAGWFACVGGAARGQLWLGPAVVAVFLLVHLAGTAKLTQEARLILVAGLFGFAIDTLQASSGLYSFAGTSVKPWLSPPWMVALWMLFATTLNSSMSWLGGRYGLAAGLGAAFGPASYVAGARLGAIELSENSLVSVIGIAIVWAIAMPALLLMRHALCRPRGMVAARRARVPVHGAAGGVMSAMLIAALVAPAGAATEIEGVRFAPQVRAADVNMQLSCVGLLRYKRFIKAYVAALYVDERTAPEEVLRDIPKRLELSYFWGIGAADFGKAGDQILAQNVDAETLAKLRPRLDTINSWYRDVKPGDRYSLTYVPGVGTELALNGDPIGVVEGADFAAAYFRIWLGDRPIDASLRDQLLGCSDSRASS